MRTSRRSGWTQGRRCRAANRRVRALIDAGRLEEVRHELDRNGPRLTPYARADALLALGRLEDALQLLSRSRAAESGAPESDIGAIALLGVVYATLGRREDAERMMAAAIPAAENPTSASRRASRAVSHWQHAWRSRPLRRGGALAHEGRRGGLPVVSAVLNGSKPRAFERSRGFHCAACAIAAGSGSLAEDAVTGNWIYRIRRRGLDFSDDLMPPVRTEADKPPLLVHTAEQKILLVGPTSLQ